MAAVTNRARPQVGRLEKPIECASCTFSTESRPQMLTTSEAPIQHLPIAHAIELFLLVDSEARWENLRVSKPGATRTPPTLKELQQKQKAHEAFIARLGIYNKAYKPAHVAELMLNNASRLGRWCRRMRDLIQQIQPDPQVPCPTHLLAKAYRWADCVADRMKQERITRPAKSLTIPATIQELEELNGWCDNLSRITS
jgi:lysozyme family protein